MNKANTAYIVIGIIVFSFCCCLSSLLASLYGGYSYTSSTVSQTFDVTGNWDIIRQQAGESGEWIEWKDLPELNRRVYYQISQIDDQIQVKTIVNDKKQGQTIIFKIDERSMSGIKATGVGNFKSLTLEYPYDNKQMIKVSLQTLSLKQPEKEKGDVILEMKDGTKVIKLKDGTTVKELKDGKRVDENGNEIKQEIKFDTGTIILSLRPEKKK